MTESANNGGENGCDNNDGSGDAIARVRAEMAARLRSPENPTAPLKVVCDACTELLPVDGAAVSVPESSGTWETLYASDDSAAWIGTVHDDLGEGPSVESAAFDRPVLVSDTAADAARAWPVFAAEIAGGPVGALFAFPLHSGAAALGTLTMHRRTAGWLRPAQLAVALRLVDLATSALLATPTQDTGEDILAIMPPRREQVHQAAGMIIAQHRIPAAEALARLRGHAFSSGMSLEQLADAVLTRRVHPSDVVE